MKTMTMIVGMVMATQVFGIETNTQSVLMGQFDTVKMKIEDMAIISYTNAFNFLGIQMKKVGDLDNYLLLQAEQKRVANCSINEILNVGLTNTCIAISNTAVAVYGDKNAKLAVLYKSYILWLEVELKKLMVTDDIAGAKLVKREIDISKKELAEIEIKLQQFPVKVAGKKLVIWNTHNGGMNDRGSLQCNVVLYRGSVKVWSKDKVDIPWSSNKDTCVTNEVPTYVIFDKVRIEITKWQGLSGGLAEVQVFDLGNNIALGCKVEASATIGNGGVQGLLPEGITDGTTTSSNYHKGYWILPDNTKGWVEIDLTKKAEK